MKRRTLDVVFSAGGLVLAALLVLAGIVLTSNANFANDYVTDQLSAQKITFKSADQLTPEEKAQPCLVDNAGKQLTTGKQAECYANNFIGLHLQSVADGKTYAELGAPQAALREQVTTAEESNDPALPQLQAQLDQITQQRDTLFKGETLRGLLLTSFGFSEFGAKAAQAATVAYIAGFVMFVLAMAGFAHAAKTPETTAFAPIEAKPEREATNV